jgi:pimeloyl-ACP methyl ester carboxylesterase
MDFLQIGQLRVAYRDRGAGLPVILAHCSSASHREWSGLGADLEANYRLLAPDLVGYGKTDRWPKDVPFDAYADVNVILGLARLAGGPVHLVGHSYGAATALEAARHLGAAVSSLTLIEPVAFHLLRLAGRAREWDEVSRVARSVEDAVREGRDARAAGVYMRYWIGHLRWWLMPRRARRGIVETVAKVAHEFGIIGRLDVPLEAYKAVRTPTRLIAGTRTRAAARAVCDVLAATLPNVHMRTIAGAGHMSPFTHARQVSALIAEHLASVTAGDRQ